MPEATIRIPLDPVVSSTIHAVGYDPDKQILAVQFKRGDIWHYAEVPPATQQALVTAESLGRYFGSSIRGKFPARKMTGTCPQCGHKPGWIGDSCTNCGRLDYEPDPKRGA